jgi:hypothetical protein
LTANSKDGTYWVLKPDHESAKTRFYPPGYEYVIMVHHRVHGRILQRVAPDKSGTVEMRYGGRANVIVEASNLPQEGLGDMWIAVVPFGGSESREVGTSRVDTGGVMSSRDGPQVSRRTLGAKNEYRNLQAGPATVILAREFDGGYGRAILMRIETTLTPGDNVVSVRLPDLHKLVVRPREGVKLRSVTIFGPGIDTSVRASADGTITAANLPAGVYSLGDTTNGWMTVTVPSAGEVMFDGLPVNSIVIRSYDREGVVYNAGLRKGDVVVSVNGERPEGYEAVRALWQNLRSKPTLDFEVLRDGRALQVTLPGASFPATDANGFNFSYRRS